MTDDSTHIQAKTRLRLSQTLHSPPLRDWWAIGRWNSPMRLFFLVHPTEWDRS
jgi:hypothetical protein